MIIVGTPESSFVLRPISVKVGRASTWRAPLENRPWASVGGEVTVYVECPTASGINAVNTIGCRAGKMVQTILRGGRPATGNSNDTILARRASGDLAISNNEQHCNQRGKHHFQHLFESSSKIM
jgi:hypothetical protein